MSLVDDVKRLAADDPVEADDEQGYPAFCRLCLSYKPHAPDCPWLAMPKIVAALEAAERVAAADPWVDDGSWGGDVLVCWACHGEKPSHRPGCAQQALVAALRGGLAV